MNRTFISLLSVIVLGSCGHPTKSVTSMAENESVDSAQSPGFSPDRFRAQFDQGIDFMASGNEPFWSLEIDFKKSMHFKTLNGFEIITPAVEGVRAMDADVTRYSATTEKGILTVQVHRQECINDMSGEKMDYTVTVDTKSNNESNYSTFKGCGRFLSDYRLNDIWVLDRINNQKINSADFMKGSPQLEFNLKERRVVGNTGCNNLSGSIEVKGKDIQFGRLVTTRMACSNMGFESTYLQKLDNQIVPYQISSGQLYLQVNADSVFSYKKID